MATRKSDNSGAVDPALPQKKRARRRLLGALAVCVAAAIVLPLVLDSEPRQVRDEVQVQIPSRDTPITDPLPGASRDAAGKDADAARPAEEPAAAPAKPAVAESVRPATAEQVKPAAAEQAKLGAAAAGRIEAKPAAKEERAAAEPRQGAKEEDKLAAIIEKKTAPAADEKAAPKADDASSRNGDEKPPATKAEDKPAPKTQDAQSDDKAKGPYQLQLGAFSSEEGAARMTAWARKAGVPTHTEKVVTKNGPRIRVRAGPYATKAEAERAKAKLNQSHLEATLVGP